MALARVFTTVRQTIIRKLGDAGGMRADDTSAELDNVIAYINRVEIKSNGYIVGYPKTLSSVASGSGNVGAGLDVLRTITVPANTLAGNNDWFKAIFIGSLAANDNDKRLEVKIDGTTHFDTGVRDLDGSGFRIEVLIFRASSTLLLHNVSGMIGSLVFDGAGAVVGAGTATLGGVMRAQDGTEGVADLAANAFTVVLSAEGVADNDIFLRSSLALACQMS